MNVPITMPPSGAIHQKRAWVNTAVTPTHCVASPAVSGCFGASGILSQMNAAAAYVVAASTAKTILHEVKRSASSSGVVAASAPAPPATIIQPASEACLATGYQVTIAFMG